MPRLGNVRVGKLTILTALCCLTAPLEAQIQGLSTTNDGSVLYFASPLNLSDLSTTRSWKIYAFDSAGLHLYADRLPQTVYPAETTLGPTMVSGDGVVVGYGRVYIVGAFMRRGMWDSVVQIARQDVLVLPGLARISANGRYALIARPFLTQHPVLRDFASESERTIPLTPEKAYSVRAHGVASDGTALVSNGATLYVFRPYLDQTLPVAVAFDDAVTDDQASLVVYSYKATLYVYDLATAESRFLVHGAKPSLSRDGKKVAFISPYDSVMQASVIGTDGSDETRLTYERDDVKEAVLSGDGTVLFAATAGNSVLRLDLRTGSTDQIVPPAANLGH